MIGVFDSGFGGLTIHEALIRKLPGLDLVYLGDHGNAPYGGRSSEDILDFTRNNVARLFELGCRLAIIACNTASAIALHSLQRYWLPYAYPGRNVLGIIVPTIEAATQVPWAIDHPVYPQMYNSQTIAVFGTLRTVESETYPIEINKRCPFIQVAQQACPELAGAIEAGASAQNLRRLVQGYVSALMSGLDGRLPETAILGCTHYPLVKSLFQEALPAGTRLLCQPGAVANSLEYYLRRHPEYLEPTQNLCASWRRPRREYYTTGDPEAVTALSGAFLGQTIPFQALRGDLSGPVGPLAAAIFLRKSYALPH
ncbi:Glutamate racemase [Azospirillaceae bacterium]